MLIDLPEPVDIGIKQGDFFRRTLIVKDATNNPINLTGYSVELNISAARRREPSWTWRNHQYISITDAVNGEIDMRIHPWVTREWAQLEQLAYEVVVESAAGDRTTILTGTLRVRLEALNQ